MKKQIIAGIAVIACVAMCAAVWLRSAAVGDLPAEPSIPAANAKIEARPSETLHILLSDITPTPKTKAVSESEPEVTTVSAEKGTAMTQSLDSHSSLDVPDT